MKVNENNEMKSHYVKPAVRVIDVHSESIIADSWGEEEDYRQG